jgi:general secretion pathway protein D
MVLGGLLGSAPLSVLTPPIMAQPPAAAPSSDAPVKPGAQKTFAFEMRDQPWDKVLEWLGNNTGVPVVSPYKPQNTLNFFGTVKKSQYTIPEIIDLLNDALLSQTTQKLQIVRRPTSILVVLADDPQAIDASLLPQLTLDELDVGKPISEQRYGRTELARVLFPLKSLSPADAQTDLKNYLSPFGKVTPVTRGNKVLVQDMVGNLRRVKAFLDEVDATATGAGEYAVVPLGALDGAVVLKLLQAQYGITPQTPRPAGAPLLELDTVQNRLIIRGDEAQIQEVIQTIRKLGGGGVGAGGVNTANLRTVSLEGTRSNSSVVIENLNYLWPDLRANPIIALTQSQLLQQLDKIKAAPPVAPPFVKPSDQLKTPKSEAGPASDPQVRQAQEQSPPTGGPLLSDPQAQPPRSNLPGRSDQPVFVAPLSRGNGLMIASEDAEALALMEEIIRYLTQPGEGDYEVIPIRYANAADVARVLDELYNGKRQPSIPALPPFMMMGGGGGRGGGGGESPTGPTVRVVADPRTNAILVRAPKMEMATIRRLLKNDLDKPRTDSQALNRRYLIGPLKNAVASEMVEIIKEIFKDYLSKPAQPAMPQMGFPFGRMPTQEQNSNLESIVITVTADDRTNMVILNAPESIYQQVLAMVEELDKTSADTTKAVRVFRTNVDPALIQRAYDAINGQQQQRPGQQPMTDAERVQQFRQQMFQRMMGIPQGGGGGRGGGNRPQGNRPRGGGRQALLDPGRPDFFAGRVMEDPRTSPQLFDPRVQPEVAPVPTKPSTGADSSFASEGVIVQTSAQAPGGGQPSPAGGQPPEGPKAPRGQVNIQAIPELGAVVVSGSPEDIEEFAKLLEELSKLNATAETELRLLPLKHADAVSATAILNQVFSRVAVGASSLNLQAAPQQQPGGFPFGALFGQQQAQPQASIAIIPLPRFNALLVGAPRVRFKEIEETLEKIDRPIGEQVKFKTFALTKANATRAAAIITQFYNQRFPGETLTQNALRVQAEPSTNTLVVQASPADLEEVGRLIDYLEKNVSNSVNEVRIVPLKNAPATDVVSILSQAINESISSVSITGAAPGQAGQPGAITGVQPGGLFGQGQLGQGLFGQQQRQGQQGIGLGQTGFAPGTAGTAGAAGGTSIGNKSYTLRFVSRSLGGKVFETGLLEDVSVLADSRTNNVIVFAPPAAMDLILALIRELDQPSSLGAEIKVFPLKRADATTTGNTLIQLFSAQAGTGLGGQPFGQAGAFGQQGFGQFGQQGLGQRPGQLQAGNLAFTGSILPIRVAIDTRTNSLIVAGARTDLIFAEAIITRLDAAEIRERQTEVYALRNSNATDIANSIQQYLNSEVQVLSIGELTPFGQIEKQVVVVPEVISNKLILSGTPRGVAEVVRLIEQLDSEQPQVVIQVLIAQVRLDNNEEFGVEWGVQTPLLFRRSIFPVTSQNLANPATPSGVTVNTTSPFGNPGFNFNTTGPLGNNVTVSPSAIGAQGLANLGVGRLSPSAQVGGFVFSAGSDAVNVLIRALKTQGKIDVLSRPQVTAMANQTAQIQSGQIVPFINGFNVNQLGQLQPVVQQQQVGIILTVQPRISPDGYVVMRVDPQVSSLSNSTVNLAPGVNAPIIDITAASTTVHAMDGQTVVIGGLITRSDTRAENKLPWLGDLPYIGAAFRYRTMTKQRRELLILLTPRVVRTRAEAEAVKEEEAKKMNWALQEVNNIHGDIFSPPQGCPLPGTLVEPEERLGPPAPLPTPAPQPGVAPAAPPPASPGFMQPPTVVPPGSPSPPSPPKPNPQTPPAARPGNTPAPQPATTPPGASGSTGSPPLTVPELPPSVPPAPGSI